MRKKYLLWIVGLCTILAGCDGQQEGKGKIQSTESGIKYQFYKENPKNKKIEVGDFVSYNFMVKNHKDSVLTSTYDMGSPIPDQQVQGATAGTLEEAILLMHEGDSLSVWVSVDSLQKQKGGQLPPFLELGTDLHYIFKIEKVRTAAQMEEERERTQKEMLEAAEKQFEEDGKQIEAYLKENNIATEKTESNLYYNITETTDNEKPQAGDSVVVHYVGKLLNGKVFDSSYSRGEPYEFVLGKGMVIKGWDIGIGLLRKGEKATLYIPSPLGYGPMAQGDLIPANAILVFDVELVDF